MSPSLTVILPVHNAERSLRRDVAELLDAAADLTPMVELIVVDDGSTDETHDTAAQIARQFPQVRVVRRADRAGAAEAIQELRSRVTSDVVIVHDGASRVSAEQLRLVWRQQAVLGAIRGERGGVSFADLRRPGRTQGAMESAHRRLMGFQRIEAAAADEAHAAADVAKVRRDAPSAPAGEPRGLGAIPPLPRPKLFGAISDFALGE